MKVTGERMILGKMTHEAEFEHLHRYEIVCKHIGGKMVLDAACGTGYGTQLMAKSAAKVYGIDVSDEAVSFAQEQYGAENVEYLKMGIGSLAFPDGFFDVVVSFETIEHVDATVQHAFMREVNRVLKSDGFFVMSTPNKKTFTDDRNMVTPFHIKEFYEDEYVKLQKDVFECVEIYHQYYCKCSVLTSYLNQDMMPMGFDDKRRGFFFLSVASHIKKNMVLDSAMYFPTEYEKYNDQVQVYYANDRQFRDDQRIDTYISNMSENIFLRIDVEADFTEIRIDPLQRSCKLDFHRIALCYADNSEEDMVITNTNADAIDDKIYTFYHNDPQIFFSNPKNLPVKHIIVDFNIIECGIDIYEMYADQNVMISKLTSDVNVCHDMLKEKEAILASHESALTEYRKWNGELQGTIALKDEIIASHASTLDEYKKWNGELQGTIGQKDEIIASHVSTLDEYRRWNGELQGEVVQKDEIIASHVSALDEYKAWNAALQQEMRAHIDALQETAEALGKTTEALEKKTRALDMQKAENEKLKAEFEILVEDIFRKKQELDMISIQQDVRIRNLDSEIKEIMTSKAWRFILALRKPFMIREWRN